MDKSFEELAILITSHPRQQIFMEHCLSCYLDCPVFRLMGYDDVDYTPLPHRLRRYVDEIFATGYPFSKLGHVRGELVQMKMGAEILDQKGYKFFYKTAADTTLYWWSHFKYFFDLLDKEKVDIVHTLTNCIFGRVKALRRIMDEYEPFETRCGSAELFFVHSIRNNKVTELRIPSQVWTEKIGRIHFQGCYAQDHVMNIEQTWEVGEIWPRGE